MDITKGRSEGEAWEGRTKKNKCRKKIRRRKEVRKRDMIRENNENERRDKKNKEA